MVRKALTILAVCVILCSTTVFAATLTLPRAGQTISYAAGDDGDLQAGIPWPAQRFTSGSGSEVDCITDNLTGLMWSKSVYLSSANWEVALSTTNASDRCGYDDWRVPNVNELESLLNAEESNNATWLNSQGFSSLVGDYFWTSTTRTDQTDQAFVINLGTGGISSSSREVSFFSKTNEFFPTLPVRGITSGPAPLWKTGQTVSYASGDDGDLEAGVAWPVSRFEIIYCDASGPCLSQASDCDGNTTTDIVTDNLTGLVWPRNPGTAYNLWQSALTYANDLSLCGYNDWRMPNRKELRSLTNYGASNGAVYLAGQGFQGVENLYWTSTTSADASANAYINYFAPADKVEEWNKTTGGSYRPWAVRAGGASDISIYPGFLDFGDSVLDQTSVIQTITITNNGSIDLVISTIEMTGTSSDMFSAVTGATNGCLLPNATVTPGASCTLDVTFTPDILGTKDALLYINSNDPDTPRVQVSLAGNGVMTIMNPLEGTTGSEITILGSGFGDSKGKVLIGTTSAKVTSWTNSRITCTVKKVPLPVGPFAVQITIKSKQTIDIPDSFTVKNPELDPLTDDNRSGIPEEEIILTGRFFGIKKGKVYLEYMDNNNQTKTKSCKITYWNMIPATGVSELRFVVPKLSNTFKTGPHRLKVGNKIGVVIASEDFIVGLP